MPALAFAQELARYGPESAAQAAPDRAAARAYCAQLATRHYENFTVASWLLPPALRPHFYHLYAYCRWADDLADETGDPERSRELLDWWEAELHACYAGEARHPVFVALADTIAEFQIPPEPFTDLLVAFRQDQTQTRYATADELLRYCRYSANPVGRLVLYLGQAASNENVALSDSVCTGLQLANFCQDVARDWDDRRRIYLPQASWQAAGYSEADFVARRFNPAFRQMLAAEVERAESYLQAGRPLVARVPRGLQIDIELFIRGGLAILTAIRRLDYNVWRTRPRVGKLTQLRLLAASWRSARRSRHAGGAR